MSGLLSGENVEFRKKPGLIQRLFFWWLCPIFYWGNKRDLGERDLVHIKRIYSSNILGGELERYWKCECLDAKIRREMPSLKRILWKPFRWRFLMLLLPTSIALALSTCQPILFSHLLKYWTPNSGITLEEATVYAISMVVCSGTAAFLVQHITMLQAQLGMSMRIGITSLIYRKMLRLSSKSLTDTTVGQIVNLMSNDCNRFDFVFINSHQVILLPIQLSVIIYFMYEAVGFSAIIGVAITAVVMSPIQALITKIISRMRVLSATRTDSRIRVMNEIISGIQVIKMYAWEEPFAKVVSETRANEIAAIKKASWARVGTLGFKMITEHTSLFFCVLSYTLLGNQMSANVLYPLQLYFSIVQSGVGTSIPFSLSWVSECLISLKRIQKFLNMDERFDLALTLSEHEQISGCSKANHISVQANDNKGYTITEPKETVDFMIELRDIEARWTADGSAALKNFSLNLKPGQFCAVVGSVGSGKSSLLQLLLKELPHTKGSMIMNGKTSYAAQEAWLFPKTVRENIIFGLPYNAETYEKVCNVCCLQPDFRQFEYGDQTLVGERGVSLSGGQRARISLARAVYRDADIYLLDDPLSAVDAKVGRKLYENCILGYLKEKTIVLVTHQLHYLVTADVIIMLEDGMISAIGRYDELLKNSKAFEALLSSHEDKKEKEFESLRDFNKGSKNRQDSTISEENEIKVQNSEQKIAPEERSKGRLKMSVLKAYFTSSGLAIVALTLFLIVLTQGTATATDYWLSYWMNKVAQFEKEHGTVTKPEIGTKMGSLSSWQYLLIYAILVIACVITVNARSFSFVEMCMRSSAALHNKMFSSMLTAVMRFFDTSSAGRILNRFSKDMGAVDELLPRIMLDTLQLYAITFSAMILNAVALPLTLVSSAVLMIINYILTMLYLNASQALKRIEGTTKSPIFGLASSSFNGIATIRSSNAQKRLIETFDATQDIHTTAWNTCLGGGAAYGHFLDMFFIIYLSFMFAVFLFVDFGDLMPIGNVGLAVSQSMSMMNLLQYGARNSAQMLAQLTALERVLEYTKLETEENLKEGKIATPKNWPSNGEIKFENVNLSYGPNLPLVLRRLDFKIPSGVKVGIVGRTGAGKSSLIAALFRFANIEGNIIIDGIDTDLVAKQELRSRISIIPQEPVLFSASIRINLDPFNKATDEEIWNALELVELKNSIPALDYKVSEGGGNFSVGQRQLVCLARAVLTSNKILVMDEATANVDPQTDSLIQKTIRSQFASCTVLTIAHRLNTIMDSDLVLVMDAGKASEFEHPHILLSNPKSMLSGMVKETGSSLAAHLEGIARDAYFSKYNILTERL